MCGLPLPIAINRGWRQSSQRYVVSKIRTEDNAQKSDYCITIPSAGTSRSYLDFNHTYFGKFWKQRLVSLVQALKVQDILKRSNSLEQGVAVSFVISHLIIKSARFWKKLFIYCVTAAWLHRLQDNVGRR
jgi:hypothetical protein